MCVHACYSCANTLRPPWTVARKAPLPMGFSRQEYWIGLPCFPPGDLPHPGTEPASLMSPASVGGLFTTCYLGSPTRKVPKIKIIEENKAF